MVRNSSRDNTAGRRLSLCDPVGTITGIRYPSAVSYQFEWDPTKATSNLKDHKVSFEASTVFGDPLAMLMADPDHSEDEERYLLQRKADGAQTQEAGLTLRCTASPPGSGSD
jgi:uncharacterized DUF497 family protein